VTRDNDEFAEFDVTEDDFDAMAAAGEPATVATGPRVLNLGPADPYVVVVGPPQTFVASTNGVPVSEQLEADGFSGAVVQRELVSS
jgi:hypothetical protein